MENIEQMFGLSEEQARQIAESGGKRHSKRTTKSYRHILFENIFSVFNLINAFIAAALFFVGSYKNCLFMIAVISNTLIGIVQEIRSKRVIDKLAIVDQPYATIVREGKKRRAALDEIVKGDIIVLENGCQIPNDCVVRTGCCEVNEALITGEADSVAKNPGDKLLSGSFVVSGSCLCEVTAAGSENYADSILGEIKYVKRTSSEIVRVVKRIITAVSVCIVPLGALLFFNQRSQLHTTTKEAVESTAAALIGMIPEGLVLLTSTVFALGVVKLARKSVLSRDLYSLEALARTDVLCLDKTGTVTTGDMTVAKLVPVVQNINDNKYERRDTTAQHDLQELITIFSALSPDNNATVKAIRKYTEYNGTEYEAADVCPFSSDRKWSAVTEKKSGLTVIVGSAEMIFGEKADYSALSQDDTENYRVLAAAVSHSGISDRKIPEDVDLIGWLLLCETLRDNVEETFSYFRDQGVDIKIISGDDPRRVKGLCSRLFGDNVGCVDLSSVADDDIPKAVSENSIFGRATPKQKQLMIRALKEQNHTVGMVGDGVNDVLALKESDCSISICEKNNDEKSDNAAARNVAQLVLLNADFSSLPAIVAQGRQSINNLQSSAALFLSKTIFSVLMALIFIVLDHGYPFEPIQMTLISTLTIGLPSFVLSFIRNDKPVSSGLLRNITANSIPAAAANIFSVTAVVLLARRLNLTEYEVSSLCVTALAVTGIALIVKIYRPLSPLKIFVLSAAACGFFAAFVFFAPFFGLAPILSHIDFYMAVIAVSDLAFLAILLTGISKLAACIS